MISFDSFTLKKWLDENAEYMIGARIQKIQQPTRRDFVFSLRNKGETKKLYININPQYYHVAFMSKDNEKKRLIEIPDKPPMFCMLLRKYLENAIISNPQAGDMIPETGGARKLRFKVYNKGKSGGYRIIYVDFISDTVVYLITLYAKSVKKDLSKSEIKDIKRAVKGVK